nr:C25 family cysteine peptidase [Ardenticatena sp.]
MRARLPLVVCVLLLLMVALFMPLLLRPVMAFHQTPTRPELFVETPDATHLVARVRMPAPQLQIQYEGNTAFTAVTVPGVDVVHQPGALALPALSYLVGLPPSGDVSLIVRQADVETIPLEAPPLPSLEPVPQSADFAPGRLERGRLDASLMAAQPLWPETPVSLGDEAWLRDQRVVRLTIAPVQYDARANALRWYRSIEVELRFEGAPPASPATSSATPDAFDTVLAASLLNYEQARAWRTTQGPVIATGQVTSSLGPRYKIEVNEDGIYRISYDDLVAAGFNPADVDPRTFRMVHEDQDIAILVEGEADGSFDPGDAVLFYGKRYVGDITNQEHYTSTNVYWLLVGETPGLRMTTSTATPSGSATVVVSHETTATYDAPNVYWAWHFADGGYTTPQETFFAEKVYINTYSAPVVTRTYPLTLHAVANEPFSATLEASAVGYATVGHRRAVYTIGDSNPISTTWRFRNRGTAKGLIPGRVLTDGVNSVQAVFTQLASGADTIYFDTIVLTYRQALMAKNDTLFFNGNGVGTWEYRVDGFSGSDIRVFDVTVPATPILLVDTVQMPTPNGYQVAFERTHGPTQRFAAVGPTGFKEPLRITYYEPPDLKSSTLGADYLVITHRAFLTQARALADYRASQGLRTMVVDVEDLYNEFNYGRWGPDAITNFLAYAYANWQAPPPTYVVLFGYGHWNGQGFDAYPNPPNFLPPNMTWTDPWQGEVDSANRHVTIVGNDILPDMLIGRIVVSDTVGAWAVVSKTIAYEQAGWQPYQQRVTFVADNNDYAGNFVAFSEDAIARITTTHPYYAVDRFYLDEYIARGLCSENKRCAPLINDLTRTLTYTGTQILSYVGHASIHRWASEYLLDVETARLLQNGARLPIVFSMDCLDGYYFYPGWMSLAQTLIQNPNGGAVATFSPTGLGVATGHAVMQEAMFDAMWRDGEWSLGQASVVGKLALYASGWNYDLIDTFTIYGDPALRLPTGFDVQMAPATQTAATVLGKTVTYTLVLTNSGQLTDTFDLTVSGSAWPTAVTPVSMTLAPSDVATVQVQVTVPLTITARSDTAIVRARSRGDTAKYAEATFMTKALFRTFAPLIVR